MDAHVEPAAVPARAGAAGGVLKAAVVVAALGYFVDVYDLVLLAIVRVRSLSDLGVTGDALVTQGLSIMNWQMVGMLLGCIAFACSGTSSGGFPSCSRRSRSTRSRRSPAGS